MSNKTCHCSNEVSSEHNISAASYFALKLAFQTLKERFEKLQCKFIFLEKENIELKHNSHDVEGKRNDSSELEKQISDLSRQKSQLSHHIYMLANENKICWDTISKLTEEKQVLLNQIRDLNLKTEKIECDQLTNKDDEILQTSIQDTISDAELEEEAMRSLHSIETVIDVSLNCNRENASDLGLSIDLAEMAEKLNEDKLLLEELQDKLKNSLDNVKKLFLGVTKMQDMKTDSIQTTDEVLEQRKSIEQLISSTEKIVSSYKDEEQNEIQTTAKNILMCPFCDQILYNDDKISEEYHQHFLHHLQDCADNATVLKSFEVV